MTNELFRPPLTAEQLREIGLRNKGNKDVIAVLWEIKRLRATILRADQLQASLGNLGGMPGMIRQGLRNDLDGEPAVIESRASKQDMLNPWKSDNEE